MLICYRVIRCRPIDGLVDACRDVSDYICFPALKGVKPEEVRVIDHIRVVNGEAKVVAKLDVVLEVVR